MKKITRGLLTLLAGELLVISQKDKKFKTTLKKKKGVDKRNYIFTTLFNFNKEIVEKTTKELENLDIEETIDDLKLRAENQFKKLQTKVDDLEEKLDNISEDDVDAYIQDIKKTYVSLKKKIVTISKEMSEKYDLEEKLVAIKKNIDTIRTSLKK